ncbi:monovalent cation/H(+) antiporter subunit G [Thermosphaera chiliense]|uniref:Monovalent cation/H(+) antiporter subunit G n=1 Tax=Thermosphaera chiliense TaxID=3402707 RepID=A0A7M1USD1_9CREN|nr:monovalent cation/H(+) antiporter subunit G [Thermosphaera aggregans]QOR94879.1 monovalent cation/H(+) antiporter subunit G [Thermosphaera aggregans]
MIDQLLFYLGISLLAVGGVLDIVASLGFFKFKEFYTRLHAATVGAIGGGFYPLIGVAFTVLGLDVEFWLKAVFSGVSLVAAAVIALGVPAGSHALARGVYRSREAEPSVVADRLREDLEKGEKK